MSYDGVVVWLDYTDTTTPGADSSWNHPLSKAALRHNPAPNIVPEFDRGNAGSAGYFHPFVCEAGDWIWKKRSSAMHASTDTLVATDVTKSIRLIELKDI